MTASETKTVTTKFKHPKATLQKKIRGAFPLSRWDPNWRKPNITLRLGVGGGGGGINALTCRETGNYQIPNFLLRQEGEGTGPHPAPIANSCKPAWASSASALSAVQLPCLDHACLHEELGNKNYYY